MPHIIVRIRPDNQTSGAAFTNTLLDLSIEVREISEPYSTPYSSEEFPSGIAQHLLGGSEASVATAFIEVPPSSISGGTADVRITIKKSGNTYVDVAACNLSVTNNGVPLTSEYSTYSASIVLAIPSSNPSIDSSKLIGVSNAAELPSFEMINNIIVNEVGSDVGSLTLTDCQSLANDLLLPKIVTPQPPLPSGVTVTLEEVYTLSGFESVRSNYESQLAGASSQTQNLELLANFIFTLATAYKCNEHSLSPEQVRLEFPTLVDEPGILTEMEIILTNISQPFTVPIAAFYILGVNFDNSLTHHERCQLIYSEPANVLENSLTNAISNGTITSTDLDSLSNAQIVRRLKALYANSSSIPVVDSSIASINNLLTNWLDETGDNLNSFWGSQAEGHLDLFLFGLYDGFPIRNDVPPPADAPFSATNTNDVNHQEELGWLELLQTSADSNTQFLFTNKITQYLQVAPNVSNIPTSIASQTQQVIEEYNTPVPSFNYSSYDIASLEEALESVFPGDSLLHDEIIAYINSLKVSHNDPISQFIDCYINIDSSVTKENFFNAPLEAAKIEEAAKCVFPSDDCAKDWLIKRINAVYELNQIAGLFFQNLPATTPPTTVQDLRFSAMEALYSHGFCSREDILACKSYQFQNALTGSILFEESFLVHLGLKLEGCATNVKGAIDVLTSIGLTNPQAILELPYDELKIRITGTPAEPCINTIYEQAGGHPIENNFAPINDGQLKNCIPAPHLDPCSPNNYLHELLKLTNTSTCDKPFPTTGDRLQLLMERRLGSSSINFDLGELEATYSNMVNKIPRINLINERLEYLVAPDSTQHIQIQNNGLQSISDHPLLYSDQSEQPEGDIYHHHPSAIFDAIPEHSTVAITDITGTAYEVLANDFSSPNLPYHLGLDTLETYLSCLGKNRVEVLRGFQSSIHEFMLDPDLEHFPIPPNSPFRSHLARLPMAENIGITTLGFTEAEYEFIFGNESLDEERACQLYGYASGATWVNNTCDVVEFLNRTGLSYCDLKCLNNAFYTDSPTGHSSGWDFIHFKIKDNALNLVDLTNCEPCDMKGWKISFPSISAPTEGLTRLILFIKLWQKVKNCLSCEALRDICEELDLLKQVPPVTNGIISPNLARKISHILLLHKEFGLPLNNGSDTTGLSGVQRTHILVIMMGEEGRTNHPNLWDWAIKAFVESIQKYATSKYGASVKSSHYIDCLIDNIDSISQLVGFDESPTSRTWYNCSTHVARYADFLARLMSTNFTMEEFLWIFANQIIPGNAPFSLSSENEALCYPLDFPEHGEYSLSKLRENLCAIQVTEEEINSLTWNEIENKYQTEFCLDSADNSLVQLGEKFFKGVLESCGCNVDLDKQRFSTELLNPSITWNSIDPPSPFQYDSSSKMLHLTLPISLEVLYKKLWRSGQLNDEEQKAVQELLFQPKKLLTEFQFIFTDFSEAINVFLFSSSEEEKFDYFKREIALLFKKWECIIEYLAKFSTAITCDERDDIKGIAKTILKNLRADKNYDSSTIEWDNPQGLITEPLWSNSLNGSSFSELLGVLGGGLLCENFDLSGNLIWREVATKTDFFGDVQNKWNVVESSILPSIGYNAQFPHAIIRNGLATFNSTGEALGGAQGNRSIHSGYLSIEQTGKYTFMAGRGTPDGEQPFFDDDFSQQWFLSLSKEDKTIELLSHNWAGTNVPPDNSGGVKLVAGFYKFHLEIVNPEPNYTDANKVCLQTTGLQIKYQGPDTDDEIIVIPQKQLFIGKFQGTLVNGITSVDTDSSAYHYLDNYFPKTLNSLRATFQRLMKSITYAIRMDWSAQLDAIDGSSELEFMLTHGECFMGYSYNWDDTTNTFVEHKRPLNIDSIPIEDNYCPTSNDTRRNPSIGYLRALTDQKELLSSFLQIEKKASKIPDQPVWEVIKNIHDDIGGDNILHLFHHLGLNPSLFNQATTFYGGAPLEDEDFKDLGWIHRICLAADCLEKMLCNISIKNPSELKPHLWAAPENELKEGLENLTNSIRWNLIEEDNPRRYQTLKSINDRINEKARKALIDYLTNQNRLSLYNNDITNNTELSEYLLMDVNAGSCQKSSRIENAISMVQTFIQRSRLGLEEFSPTSKFNQMWDKKMSSYSIWKKCKKRELYPENFKVINAHEKALKSPSYKLFNDKLREDILSVPVSGGMTVLNSPKPPQYSTLNLLQKTEPMVTSFMETTNGFNLLGAVHHPSKPSFIANTNVNELPYWIQSALKIGVNFIDVNAAGIPPAAITYDCEYEGCCSVCGKIHPPTSDKYWLGLVNSKQFKDITQDINWAWDDISQLPSLLSMNPNPTVHLLSCRVHNGNIQTPRISSEGVLVSSNPQISFLGRNGNHLNIKVENGILPVGNYTSSIVGFRYDMLTDHAVAVPQINEVVANGNGLFGLSGFPYFAFYEQGSPTIPKSNFSHAMLLAGHLESQCQFEDALNSLEFEYSPLKSSNTWLQGTASEEKISSQAVLLKYLKILHEWGLALMRNKTGESLQKAQVIFSTAKKILGDCPPTIKNSNNEILSTPQTIGQLQVDAPSLNLSLICLYDQIDENCTRIQECINAWNLKNCKKEPNYWNTPSLNDCQESFNGCTEDIVWCLSESQNRHTFSYLLQKAKEYVGTAISLGNTLISILEKRDVEALASLRERQNYQLQNLNLSPLKNQVRVEDWNTQGLEISLSSAVYRRDRFLNLFLNGLIPPEQDFRDKTNSSKTYQTASQISYAAAQSARVFPDIFAAASPITWLTFGNKAAGVLEVIGKIAQIFSTIDSIKASLAADSGRNARRSEEWFSSYITTSFEVEQIKRQLQAARRNRENALKRLNIHQIQIEHSKEIFDFLRDKFTNQELYHWMAQEVAGIYKETLNNAVRMAHHSQNAYKKECLSFNENFLDIPTSSNLRKGLLNGDNLLNALQNMESSYINNKNCDYELTTTFSLRNLDPHGYIELIYSGQCVIDLKEEDYNRNYPGHIKRVIRALSVTIPCVVGPYENVNAKIIQLSSKIRMNSNLNCKKNTCCDEESKSSYTYQPNDSRFLHYYGAREALATSRGNNDSGMFELSLNNASEKYNKFEFTGAICSLCIELNYWDNNYEMKSIADVLLQVNYEAEEGGKILEEAARIENQNYLPGNGWKLFKLKDEHPDAWYQMEQTFMDEDIDNEFILSLGRNHFPFVKEKNQLYIDQMEFYIEACEEIDCNYIDIQLLLNPKERDEHPDKCKLTTIRCYKREDLRCLFHGKIELDEIHIPKKGVEPISVLVLPSELKNVCEIYCIAGYGVNRMDSSCKKLEDKKIC